MIFAANCDTELLRGWYTFFMLLHGLLLRLRLVMMNPNFVSNHNPVQNFICVASTNFQKLLWTHDASGVSILDTHLVLTFDIPRYWWRMFKMVVRNTPIISASRYFIKRASSITNFSSFSTISEEVASTGLPDEGHLKSTLFLACKNCVTCKSWFLQDNSPCKPLTSLSKWFELFFPVLLGT